MRRVLLHPAVDRAAIDRAAADHGWPLLNILGRREGRPRQLVFGGPDWLLTFVDDHRIAARYAVAASHAPDALADAVRASLPSLSLDDVLARLDEDRIRAVCWLGVVGPDAPAEPVARILREAASAEDPALRDAARFACDSLGWAP